MFHVHFGVAESKLSPKLMKAISIQLIDEDMGVPISDEILLKAKSPDTYRYVNLYIQIVNQMGQEQIVPIFYKGTTLSNFKEACHVLSCNN